MRLTHLADYAVVMMTAAARREPCARLSATELSEDTGVPLPTAQKLMQKLAAHGLLVGHRGQGGGYALARPVDEISLADIVEAVEGPIVLTMCADGVNHECVLDAHCKVKPHMSIVGDAIRTSLKAVSLAQLSSPAEAGAQTRRGAAPLAPDWAPAFAGEQQVQS
jgi:FeS assembly SUF system regulator